MKKFTVYFKRVLPYDFPMSKSADKLLYSREIDAETESSARTKFRKQFQQPTKIRRSDIVTEDQKTMKVKKQSPVKVKSPFKIVFVKETNSHPRSYNAT